MTPFRIQNRHFTNQNDYIMYENLRNNFMFLVFEIEMFYLLANAVNNKNCQ